MTDTTDKQASGALRQAMNRSYEVANYSRPPFRTCEFCGCHTNARVRACCEKGRAADGPTKGLTP